MSSSTLPEASRIFPTLRYRESLKMLDWLIEAFGLRVHRKYLKGRRWRTASSPSARPSS